MSSRFRRFLPLLVLIVIDLLWCSYLLASRRIPLGHDGFQYLYLKYYFFNEFVKNGELAQWLPYLTHGSPSSWWYVVQSGIFDAVAMFVARLLRAGSFLPVFYFLLFCEKLLFTAGMWLLASEHYRSRAAVFVVSAAMTATSIWYTQPWWNFHAVIALPMLLFLVHRTFVDFRWTWLCGLAVLFFQQSFGHLSYYLPMTLLFLTAYACLLLTQPGVLAAFRTRFHFSLGGILILTATGAAMRAMMLWLQRSTSDILFAYSSREPDGSVSLQTFLTHAGYTDLRSWNQLLTGLSPQLDFTMFCGFLIFGLLILTFTERGLNRSQTLFAWLTVGTALLASASPLATLVYYLWPLGSYFRHLVLLQPVTKMFCILLAGATLDRILSAPQPFRSARVYSLTAVLLPCAILLSMVAYSSERLAKFLDGLRSEDLPFHPAYPVSTSRLMWGVAALALTWFVLFKLLRAFNNTKARQRLGWAAALLLLVDVSIYQLIEMRARTQRLSLQEASAFTFTPLPYAEKRSLTPQAARDSRLVNWDRPLSKLIGESYWSQDLLAMVDSYRTTSRTVFWPQALGSLLVARTPPRDLRRYQSTLALPADDKLLIRVGGLEKSKVGFHSQAISCPDAASTATVLGNPAFNGRVALLTVSTTNAGITALPCDSNALPDVDAAPQPEPVANVMNFRSNGVTFQVNNSVGIPLVMTYSDVWNDRWSARVNGTPAPVLRSALAYKAVIVPPGNSVVEFVYRDKLQQLVFALQTLGTVSFLGFLVWLIRLEMAGPTAAVEEQDEIGFRSTPFR